MLQPTAARTLWPPIRVQIAMRERSRGSYRRRVWAMFGPFARASGAERPLPPATAHATEAPLSLVRAPIPPPRVPRAPSPAGSRSKRCRGAFDVLRRPISGQAAGKCSPTAVGREVSCRPVSAPHGRRSTRSCALRDERTARRVATESSPSSRTDGTVNARTVHRRHDVAIPRPFSLVTPSLEAFLQEV